MKLSHTSIGMRLGLSFGVILIITALIAVTGIWRIASLHDASERVATQEIEQQTMVEDWASDIRLNWVRTEAFLKAIDLSYMEKLTADTQATATGMDAKVKRIEALVQGEQARGLLGQIAAARLAYNTKLNEIRELHRGGEPNVPMMVDKELRPLADSYLQSLDGLRKASPAASRAALTTALDAMGEIRYGAMSLRFAAPRTGSSYVGLTMIDSGGQFRE